MIAGVSDGVAVAVELIGVRCGHAVVDLVAHAVAVGVVDVISNDDVPNVILSAHGVVDG